MNLDTLSSPSDFLHRFIPEFAGDAILESYEDWMENSGSAISFAVDGAGTPRLRMFDIQGERIDEIGYSPDYWTLLKKGYKSGALWRVYKEDSLLPFFQIGYLTSFYDAGLYCPHTVSLSTLVSLDKYGSEAVKSRFLPYMLREDEHVWQGATWMTEIRGGSDLGNNVETEARQQNDRWLLNGDKYFASNVGAELAIVAARPQGAPSGIGGLALFLLPRRREDGQLNYFVRRLKDKIGTRSVPTGEVELRDSVAYLLGKPEWGIYLILEALNLSRVANCIASVAVVQRVLHEAAAFAAQRHAFGKPILEHPLLRRQFDDRTRQLKAAFALAWEAVRHLDEVWRETPPYSERYHCFRLLTHLAKYWTAELAVRTSRWGMEVHGGLGVLAEYPAERWFREAIILSIWEGTPHRQILDGLEVMRRKHAHAPLFQALADDADPQALDELRARLDAYLSRAEPECESDAERLFHDLAVFSADTFLQKLKRQGAQS